MTTFTGNIEELTLGNTNFRQVLSTGQHTQLVVMSLMPNEDIGVETHQSVDQFIRVEKGEAQAVLNGQETMLKDGSAVLVPAGTEHNIINLSAINPLKLYTLYSPPHHRDGVIHTTKADALADTSDHL